LISRWEYIILLDINQLPERATVDVVHFDLAAWAKDGLLATREQGEDARSALQRELLANPPDAPVGIDASGVSAISYPFADSFFAPLLSGWASGYYDEHPIVVFGANRSVFETIDAALQIRKMGVVIRDNGNADLLGGEPALRDTIRVASKLDSPFSAKQLGLQLGVTPQAINNRLKALVKMGALVRVPVTVPGGGREFAYQVADARAASHN
jgi:hypothetical protein